MSIFSLCFRLLLSLLSFLLHTITNSFKKHIHSFMRLATAINTTTSNNATDNLKCHHPISSTADDHEIDDDENEDGDGDGDDCCSWRRVAAEGRRNWREVKSFPPPISSLNPNGQRSFFLQPVRKNGRLKITKVRIKRSEILYAWRQDGRLRMYLVDPDQCEEEEEEELVESEAEEEEDEEIRDKKEEEEEEDRVGEIPMWGNDGFRRCHHQVVNQCYCVHGSHHHLHNTYGLGIA